MFNVIIIPTIDKDYLIYLILKLCCLCSRKGLQNALMGIFYLYNLYIQIFSPSRRCETLYSILQYFFCACDVYLLIARVL